MDAAGNLTDSSEFTNNRRMRFISYLDEDVAIGVSGGNLCVHRISAGDPDNTIFIANQWEGPGFNFGSAGYLMWAPSSQQMISSWGQPGDQATLVTPEYNPFAGSGPPQFNVNFFNGCWMTLTDIWGSSFAIDCAESVTDEGNPILLFGINGGDNQTWRATTIGPGLG